MHPQFSAVLPRLSFSHSLVRPLMMPSVLLRPCITQCHQSCFKRRLESETNQDCDQERLNFESLSLSLSLALSLSISHTSLSTLMVYFFPPCPLLPYVFEVSAVLRVASAHVDAQDADDQFRPYALHQDGDRAKPPTTFSQNLRHQRPSKRQERWARRHRSTLPCWP